MKLTNKRLKHLAKRGKASLAEQRELAARVLQAEKPRPQGQRRVMWDLETTARRDYCKAQTVVRMRARPYLVEILRPDANDLCIDQYLQDDLLRHVPRSVHFDTLRRMAGQLGEALFSDPRVPRSSLLAHLLEAAPNS